MGQVLLYFYLTNKEYCLRRLCYPSLKITGEFFTWSQNKLFLYRALTGAMMDVKLI